MKLLDFPKCDKCAFVKTKRTQGAGYAHDYHCSKKDDKLITKYVEWDSDLPEIPNWCPFKVFERAFSLSINQIGKEEFKAILLTDPDPELRDFASKIEE